MASKSKVTPKSSESAKAQQTAAAAQQGDAVTLLSADHRKVEQLFSQYQKQSEQRQKAQLARQISTELIIHTLLEEEFFYPTCRERGVDSDMLAEAQVEHDGAKVLINELLHGNPEDEYFDAKVEILSEYIRHHVAEEEKTDGIFAKAKSSGINLTELGQKLQARKTQLLEKAQAGAMSIPPTRSFDFEAELPTQERAMEGRYYRPRDEQGRFESSERGYRGQRSHEDDDYDRSGRSSGGGRGWYGESRGRGEAAERGWDERRVGRSEDYDEERSGGRGRYSSRDRDDDERSSSSDRGRGWYGDPQGHSEASERGWEGRSGASRRGGSYRGRDEDDDRSRGGAGRGSGHGGWFGDPEGHSRAAEEGWEQRGSGEYRRSSSRDEDDGNGYRSSRGSRGGGHGGWFGDPEGHSRAAEEGWEHRGGARSAGRGR
jgi:hypothetical protein